MKPSENWAFLYLISDHKQASEVCLPAPLGGRLMVGKYQPTINNMNECPICKERERDFDVLFDLAVRMLSALRDEKLQHDSKRNSR